ncbi:Ser/Thr protein kinase RdoA involved in Cpx stress response, MazF antagonist [Paenibacillus sp. yr247]|uniref:phosphotransferase enzyme family protein n=1 Tax=Paenibacillus sp. yr247 TaxID=1761880 RepID=UPI00088749A7|nr:phosphotransferase [Paenibacillus sp. yr247]SDM77996.1 Ser/Thr protein kinase RdoA involved in Cpx stress response, MazF antagonist [Paenibacillus sp. yr247]
MYENIIKDLLLEQYSMHAEQIEFISHSNKIVYKVYGTNKEEYVFDIYLKREEEGSTANDDNSKYFTPAAIASEVRILNILNEKYPELKSPSPIKNKDGQLLSSITVNGTSAQCLLRNFIAGNELVKGSEQYVSQAYNAGAVAAKLHQCSNQHLQSEYSNRPVHRQQYVQNIIHTVELGIDAGTITTAQNAIVKEALEFIIQRMDEMDQNPYYTGIVHTDLRDANFLSDGEKVIPIDFGRCVYGYLLYDLGEMCAHMGGDDSEVQMIKGYHSIRRLTHYDIVTIEAFKILFILSVIAEFILQKDNSYVSNTLKRLTETDLVHLLSSEPVIPNIRSVI